LCVCLCRRICQRSATPPPAAAAAILRNPPRSPSEARLGAGRPRRSPRLARRLLPSCLKVQDEPEPAVSYRAAEEEVHLRAREEQLPDVYAEAHFSHDDAPAAVPPPPHYSTLPRGRRPSHGELGRRLASLS
jgi:hypothetical protein